MNKCFALHNNVAGFLIIRPDVVDDSVCGRAGGCTGLE
jgi:hypothetical protein